MTDNPGLKNETNDLIVFIPSFDRPMQLDATLKSFYKHCVDSYQYEIRVIYRVSNDRYKKAYESLKSDYENVIFIKENVFKQHLMQSIVDKTYILFIVDDCLFVRPFSLKECKNALVEHPKSIGFSLRLGGNTIYCYPTGQMNVLPNSWKKLRFDGNIQYANWTEISGGDFSYPLEVSSSLYRIKTIGHLLENCSYQNPNDLEWAMACNAKSMTDFSTIFFYETSVAFCNPINKVQRINNNRSGSFAIYQPDALLEKFENGNRIDIDQFDGLVTIGCHQEVDLVIKEKNEQE